MKKIFTVGAVSALLLTGFGCLPTPGGLIKNAVENKLNAELGGQGSVNLDDNTYTYTDKESGITGSYGENVQIPKDFPSTLPVMPNAKPVAVSQDKHTAAISYIADKSADEVVSWYESQLSEADHWDKQGTYSGGGATTEIFARDADTITVLVMTDDSGKVSVTASLTNNAE